MSVLLQVLGLAGAVVFGGPFFVLYAVLATTCHWILYFHMRRQRRLISRQELFAHASNRRGTLIFEGGKFVERIWWTPEKILEHGPRPIHVERPPRELRHATGEYIKWCERGCVNRRGGNAMLLAVNPLRIGKLETSLWDQRGELCDIIYLHGLAALDEEGTADCVHCGYSRVGLESDLCPECGRIQPPPGTSW